MIGISGLFTDTSFPWACLPRVKQEDQSKFKQANAKDKATYQRCPACLTFFLPNDTKNDNAICPNCSKEVPEGNDFARFSCSNCNQPITVHNVRAIVICDKCSFLIIDFIYQ
jgi:DNA-directed RNA polymerase subunit RPC12/RpoP